MALLRAAFQALQHNGRTVLAYVAIKFALGSITIALHSGYIEPRAEALGEDLVKLFGFITEIVIVPLIALVQTVAFSRLGRDIDRPMWRVASDAEATRLFYAMWLILGLVNLLAINLLNNAAPGIDDPGLQLTLLMFWLLGAVLLVPFGASVMFYGRAGTEQIGLALSTMMHHFPKTLLIVVVGFLFGFVIINLQLGLPVWVRPAVYIFDAYLECYLFAAMWLVCMFHRDDYEMPDDDFDM